MLVNIPHMGMWELMWTGAFFVTSRRGHAAIFEVSSVQVFWLAI
jgi:hypothetical protein